MDTTELAVVPAGGDGGDDAEVGGGRGREIAMWLVAGLAALLAFGPMVIALAGLGASAASAQPAAAPLEALAALLAALGWLKWAGCVAAVVAVIAARLSRPSAQVA